MKRILLFGFILLAGLLVSCTDTGEGISDLTEYRVTFDGNGGGPVVDPVTIIEGGLLEQPHIITRTNYEFTGWYLEDVKWEFDVMPVLSDIQLKAGWKLIDNNTVEFEVTFNVNGGQLLTEEIVLVEENSKVMMPQANRDSYKLIGWFTNDNIKWDFNNNLVISNLTLTAKWELEIIDIDDLIIYEHNFEEKGKESNYLSFDSTNNMGTNYGEYNYEGVTYTSGYKIDSKGEITFTTNEDNLILTIVVGRRFDDPTFVKLNDNTKQIINKHEVLEFELPSAGKYTISRGATKEFGVFYLKIESETPTKLVTFDSKGGTSVENIRTKVGTIINKPNNPTHATLDFVGWYVDEDYTTLWVFSNNLVNDNLTLYAKWELLAVYEVTIDGTIYNVKEGNLIDLTPLFIEGKVFLGWYSLADELFDSNTKIYDDLTLNSKYRDAEQYAITFELDGGTFTNDDEEILLYEYEEIIIEVPTKEGFIFGGYYLDNDFHNQFTYDLNTRLSADLKLYVLWLEVGASENLLYGVYFEAFWVQWQDTINENTNITYQLRNTTQWITLDKELIRQVDNSNVRADIVGLKAGIYNVKITASDQSILYANGLEVMEHDRSGYAHFNYTKGIGGYKDDGTLKDDAIVVYVTDENKDTIAIPGLNHSRLGIGWILNNNQYNSGSSNTNSSTEYQNSLATFNKPLVIRFIGKVTAPAGLTVYDSTDQGGSKGDNGNMARIRDGNDITLEGIGDDAVIYGWGLHLIAASQGRGIGFEVRNLTFDQYPEDAVGLEGQQSGSTLTTPVQRGWVHNSTFLEGFHPNPAESDKKEGDGSLDIKRGEYFTISYNQFINGSKTNLVGSSDTAVQYHITYHHNLWRNARSRVPLARNGNIHMYNNVFETVSEQTLSSDYIQNTRANAYIFSEANFFMGVKSPSRVDSGAIKSFNDIKYSIWNLNEATHVNERTQAVSSGNKFENFDTNSQVFYYDVVNKVSDVMRLTDAVTARAEVYQYAGTFRNFTEVDMNDLKITNIAPTLITESVEMNQETKILKETPLFVFELTSDASFEMVTNHSVPATLVDIFGREMLTGSGMIELAPGIYSLQSSINYGYSKGKSQAKESQVTSYKIILDSGEASQGRIDNATNAIKLLPKTGSVTYTSENLVLIQNAINAYNNLRADETTGFDYGDITVVLNEYINNGKMIVEGLINEIGVVNESSLDLIETARSAYNNAIEDVVAVITNVDVLISAEAEFVQYQVIALNNLINDLPLITPPYELSNMSEIIDSYDLAKSLYEILDEELLNDITNYNKVIEGIDLIEQITIIDEMNDYLSSLVIDEITFSNSDDLVYYYNYYNNLNNNDLEKIISSNNLVVLNEAWNKFQTLLEETRVYVLYYNSEHYNGDNTTVIGNYFTGNVSSTKDGNKDGSLNYNGIVYKKTIEINSSFELNFTITSPTATFRILFTKGSSLKLNGDIYTAPATGEIFEIQLTAGDYTLTRNVSGTEFGHLEVIE